MMIQTQSLLVTVSSPSQETWTDTEESEVAVAVDLDIDLDPRYAEKETQTVAGIFLSEEDYELLVRKAEHHSSFKEDLVKLRQLFSRGSYNPEMDTDEFEKLCKKVGAENLFLLIYDAMCCEKMSEDRKKLNRIRSMVVIYMMMYGQSQRANWFQVALSRTLQQFGITEQGLASLRNLGIAAHPRTFKAASLSTASSHLSNLQIFFNRAIQSNQFLVMLIDDYHNIHTKHCPESKTQTQAIHMSTLLVKTFPNVKAIRKSDNLPPLLSKEPVDSSLVRQILTERMPYMSSTFAQNMPDWMVAKYFDPEKQRHRLAVYDYQHTEVNQMRKMDNCKLIDCIELPLKPRDDLLSALEHMLSNGLANYLEHFIVPFVGDWPTQFYMRQLAYSPENSPSAIHEAVDPLIGPLHISLNSRECVLMKSHTIFAELYSFLFGSKAKSKKPKPWRVSLLLEVLYGGWTLVRDSVLPVFSQCKDLQYLTLLNLLDNYIPLVLSIYSIVFKSNDLEMYSKSFLHCSVLFMVFRRCHYDKALVVALSVIKYGKCKTQVDRFDRFTGYRFAG